MCIYAPIWASQEWGKEGFFYGEKSRQSLKEWNTARENSQKQEKLAWPLAGAGIWQCLLSFCDKLTPALLRLSTSLQQKTFHIHYTLINFLAEFKWKQHFHHGKHGCREKMGKAVGKNKEQKRSPFWETASEVHWFGEVTGAPFSLQDVAQHGDINRRVSLEWYRI